VCVYVGVCMCVCTCVRMMGVCMCVYAGVCVCEALSYFTMVLVDRFARDAKVCVGVRLLICCN
jgi:hypothetical protein